MERRRRNNGLLALGLMLSVAVGCEEGRSSVNTAAASERLETVVRTPVLNAEGKTIGTAELTQERGGVRVRVEASGLSPGAHGFHIHETGRCDAPDFKTAGAHLNPEGKKHGLHNPQGPHAGDMPNLQVGSDGKGKADWVAPGVTLAIGKPNSLLKEGGTAIVIHEQADDDRTDPAGNAGARIACGVIR
ncbi:superoxide dismutase family protein [Paenibacillus flagellatus]|uniref:Superoxide dismutase [Cu-Zn] n=1 Tax=Paenibacillus flagellatus TaxID=2211139 RepID=A0A2V5KGX2_9BACL|nr:superoxide dismutase family protein [Paenibacillus flagellatus]PYI53510.1 superoxide dismutase [Paenibacillus flagellatus]